MTALPLSGVRVVDLTRILSGPFCSMLLGDLGADVVKIEAPGGDPVRQQGHDVGGLSWYFAAFNRNKKSIELNLRDPKGIAVLERLLSDADILTENFRPGVLEGMGLTAARLREINPGLIVVSVNGYGSTGPYADRPAFDFIAQAMSGYMATNGTPETGPLRTAPPITDLVAGLYAALAAVSALRSRENGGPVQRVEASMMMSMLSMMAYLSSNALATGRDPVPTGNDHPIASPYGLFRAADGDIAVAPSTEVIVRRFLREIGLEHLLSDPRFENNEARLANRADLNAMINEALAGGTQDDWIARLNRAGVPCGRVQSMTEALADPQVAAQEMVLRIPHEGRGEIAMTGFPMKFSETPLHVHHPVPELGADGRASLLDAGLSDAEIDALIEQGILGPGTRGDGG
ncbi:CoA transferase [Psychromarinibacter sp. C21-152]|uniref:CoA transferase n=1 Tax=Psychromarinibacter sediminicola TaxID=3033385 RepID=A0AAE3NW57_9RHOB|nr:CoA transferase [Psychromarinibacter sediminicola]MDF0603221.1 CoA transferase [Psychromarinibacter sediminicola]